MSVKMTIPSVTNIIPAEAPIIRPAASFSMVFIMFMIGSRLK